MFATPDPETVTALDECAQTENKRTKDSCGDLSALTVKQRIWVSLYTHSGGFRKLCDKERTVTTGTRGG